MAKAASLVPTDFQDWVRLPPKSKERVLYNLASASEGRPGHESDGKNTFL